MAESDFSTEQKAKPRAKAGRAVDTINARHHQVLGILSYILADLADLEEGASMPPATLSNSLWAAQALLEQAQEAATAM
jgi:hypothetical protein